MISQRTPFAILLAAVCLLIIGLGLSAKGETRTIDPSHLGGNYGANGMTLRSGEDDNLAARAILVPGSADINDFVVTDCTFNAALNAITCTAPAATGQSSQWCEGTNNGGSCVTVGSPASLSASKTFSFDANGYMHKSFIGEYCNGWQSIGTNARIIGRFSDGGTLSGAAFTCWPAASTAALTDCQMTTDANIYACADGESRIDGCTLAGHLTGTMNEGNTGTFTADTPAIADGEWLVVVPGTGLATNGAWSICVTVTQ